MSKERAHEVAWKLGCDYTKSEIQRLLELEPEFNGKALQAIVDQRDSAEHALCEAYKAVTGLDAKWCEYYVYCDAVDEIRRILSLLKWKTPESDVETEEPKWIKCSDRLPDLKAPIYFIVDPTTCCGARTHELVYAGCHSRFNTWPGYSPQNENTCNCYCDSDVTHWMPRYVPAPPYKEESELVKALHASYAPYGADWPHKSAILSAIEIVKRFEKEGKVK